MDEPLEERPDLRPPPSESHPVLLEPREVAVPVRGCHEKGEQQVHRDLANERARVSVESLDLRVRVRVQSPVAGRRSSTERTQQPPMQTIIGTTDDGFVSPLR